MPSLPSELAFVSLLSYVPVVPQSAPEEMKKAKDVMWQLKKGKKYPSGTTVCQLIAQRVYERRSSPIFKDFFGPEVVAVPVPSSSMKKPGSLWIPLELATELKTVGLVGEVEELALRTAPLPKSATSSPKERPKAIEHHGSIGVIPKLLGSRPILLVDDVVTRGATMLGVAARLLETYPDSPVFGFAAMRAISEPADFTGLVSPVKGWITLKGDQTRRRP